MSSIKAFYQSLASGARRGLLIGLVLLALATVAALWWIFSPRESLLFGNLEEADAAEIAAALEEWKVPHHFTPDGTGILVDEEQMHALRMRLVSAGVPRGGHVGFELFDDNEFGVTEFAQRINYQRALQGEIERTIATVPGVQSARVHLSIRRPGLFLADEAQSKASVALTLVPGAALERKQVAGIRNLVASAVDGLQPESVVVVGPSGMQLLGGTAPDSIAESSGTADELASALEAKIGKVVAHALDGQQAAISVNVAMNFDRVHTTSERLLGTPGKEHGLLVRSNRNGDRAPEGATAPAGLLNEQLEYAHGRERQEVTRATGAVERITVAILLPSSVPATQQAHLRRLAAAAAGLDFKRGDSLEVAVASPRVAPVQQPSVEASSSTAVSRATLRAFEGVPSVHPLWMLVALVLGALGMWVLRGKRSATPPKALSHEESEQAARNIRAWLAGEVR
ncbi:flagellar basal-body MS-ring/collar protein FliF [Pseudoxanthomonas sp. PXM02]|uniref:flagellar basal-body MS-ring/collar protein FliF n=1 Tax=Pseudoxanthomonas sp. PXM02 TaxID=2769294 RepID=UPI0031F30FA8